MTPRLQRTTSSDTFGADTPDEAPATRTRDTYTTPDGAVYTSHDGRTFTDANGVAYVSADGRTFARDGKTVKPHKAPDAVDHKSVADLINRINSGGNLDGHFRSWAQAYGHPARAAYAAETRAAEKQAASLRKAALRAQLADLEE